MNVETQSGSAAIERWWPQLSIEAKHRVLTDLEAELDDTVLDEIERLCGQQPSRRLDTRDRDFIRTQIEAVD